MFKILKKNFCIGFSGKFQSLQQQCTKRGTLFDKRRVNFLVSSRSEKFIYYATCYCSDAFLVSDASNYIKVYESKFFQSKHEAAVAMELEIISLSREFKDTQFFMEKYFVEHDLFGESMMCVDGCWSKKNNHLQLVCNECNFAFNEKPLNSICQRCGGYVT
jgi:4-hydroxyphenylpyruvate dioxygenase-like putative hemolysin